MDQTDTSSCCASCGIAEIDDIKLMECADCDLVRYCSDACQKEHRPQHKEDCRMRAAELRDELLFKQPESSHLGNCPICCLPLSLDRSKSAINLCCSKVVCNGCDRANMLREVKGKLEFKCPFCRQPVPKTAKDTAKQIMKRIEANDPVAMRQWGSDQYKKGDYSSAFEYYTRAAELGDIDAHYQLAGMYRDGRGVEKDKQKEIHHLELAAIGGHPTARYNLGCEEWEKNDWDTNDNAERAVKHWIIAAALGDDGSIEFMMEMSEDGYVSKDDLDTALRAHQAAVDKAKSPQREAAERAAELRDEILFKQPESSDDGDCPICYLPLQLDKEKSCMMSCCSKVICNGCNYANRVREIERRLKKSCPFCRQPVTTKDEADKRRMKRIEANDPVAMCGEGFNQYDKGDYSSAFEYFTKAAELGDIDAHYQLAVLYQIGQGVEKDKQKEIHHLELAAIGGHPDARYNLGCEEWYNIDWDNNANAERAVKHWIIAAALGNDSPIEFMMEMSEEGYVSKDDLGAALRAHQAAVDAAKSPQREAAEEFYRTRTTS